MLFFSICWVVFGWSRLVCPLVYWGSIPKVPGNPGKIHTFLPPVIKHEQLGNHPYIQGFSSHLWWLKSICHIYSLYMSMNHPNCREVALSIPFFILSSFCSTKLALMFSALFFLAAKYVKVDAPRSGGVSREQNQCDSSRSREVLRRCWSS